MQFSRLTTLILSAMTYLFSQPSLAAAYQLYELGTPIIGTAAVGQAAVADDASTAYFNPAGMGLFNQSQFMLGSQLLVPYTNFSKNSSNTISGDNGGNAGMLTPGMDLYYVGSFTHNLKFGLSLTSPYGGALFYNNGWVGRYDVQTTIFYTINLNPSIAYRFNDWVALGAGVAVEYMNLQETVALPLLLGIDGGAKISVANIATGYNLGVMLTPYPSTRIGIAYRSQIVHNLHGNTSFLRISDTPNTSTRLVMPQNVIISLAQQYGRINLLAEAGWANWAAMRNTVLTIQNYTASAALNWSNTYRVGLGLQYKVVPRLKLQLGASYDSSPTTASKRLPALPMDRQYRIGAGLMYALIEKAVLGMSYEYWNLGNAPIYNVSNNGVLAGSYSRNYANAFQVSLNVEI